MHCRARNPEAPGPGQFPAVLPDGRPLNAYLPGAVDVLTVDTLFAQRLEGYVVVDLNHPLDARLTTWLDLAYKRLSGLPSTRWELTGHRLQTRRDAPERHLEQDTVGERPISEGPTARTGLLN